MRRSHWVVSISSLALLVPTSPEPGLAQTISFTPTFQQSVSQYSSLFPQSEYQALGFMVGLGRAPGWWEPHVWFQRYQVVPYRQDSRPGQPGDGGKTTGWMVSVGPAIELLRSGRITGDLLPQVGMATRGTGDLNGGAGVHVGFDVGFFQPQIFGRYEHLGPGWFWTLGVGMTFEVRWEELVTEGSPWG
jgi:hypothetical protein